MIRKLPSLLLNPLSFFTRSKATFYTLMIAALVCKIAVSALTPASTDLRDIVLLSMSNEDFFVSGPWVTLTTQMIKLWTLLVPSNITPNIWVQPGAPAPFAMPTDLVILATLVRLPTLVFDVGVAVLLYFCALKITSSLQLARLTSLVWSLNPYATFVIEMLAVPDVAAAFFTVATVVLLLRKRILLASIALATGIAIKFYPILLIVPFLFHVDKIEKRTSLKILSVIIPVLGLSFYFAWALQLRGLAPGLSLLLYTPETQQIRTFLVFSPGISIGTGAVAVIVFYFVLWWFMKSAPSATQTFLPVLLVFYAFSDVYPQYLVWALPFLSMDMVFVKRRNLLFLVITVVLMFVYGLVAFTGYVTPSGYSLLFVPLAGRDLPSYSLAFISFLKSDAMKFVFPFIKVGFSATCLIYAIEIIREWTQSARRPETMEPYQF